MKPRKLPTPVLVDLPKPLTAAERLEHWFEAQGWTPFEFQRNTWAAYFRGESGLIHATTGTGKTYALWLAAVLEGLAERPAPLPEQERKPNRSRSEAEPLRVLWITPLRALAADTAQALQFPLEDLPLPWTIETRTGDTASSVKLRQKSRLPTALITTPESLTLLLTRPTAPSDFAGVRLVVVDEWHELIATKRGVQTELALARLRKWAPSLRTWGLSATLGNLPEARDVLLGNRSTESAPIRLIEGQEKKSIQIDSILPPDIERFPWAGHLGLKLLPEVLWQVEAAASSLIFTNTRSQTELWYQAILKERPGWAGQIALHHGSLETKTRRWVEKALRAGTLKCVVCTSTLDLGVDFSPVERVFQVGSPKGVARLLQRAGRSGHSPNRESRVTGVPTHAWELIEFAAARDAIASRFLESRPPLKNPIDVLAQHAVTMAVGGGFTADSLLEEIQSTASYASLTEEDWRWVLDFVTTGGPSLRAYPDYQKVHRGEDGQYRVDNPRIARHHLMAIGTIVSEAHLQVQFLRGPKLGSVEEAFAARLKPGDRFVFAGRLVQMVKIQDARLWVKAAKAEGTITVPRWMGGWMPLSTELASAARRKLDQAAQGIFDSAEMRAVQPLLELQQEWSQIPRLGEFLVEKTVSREGYHYYFYPFAGRLVHEGLAALFAYRLSRRKPLTFSMAVNDYGLELLCASEAPVFESLSEGLLASDGISEEIRDCINATEMSKRQFREVAHIAGLVFGGYPGQRKTARQLQASTGLIYEVFRNYEPENRLLKQAQEEVLERQLEQTRLIDTLKVLQKSRLVFQEIPRFTPFCFPLMVERLRERVSSEKLADRVKRLQEALERSARKI
ncbi:ligase-associated DNA damage response DEXH box helicase [Telmatocola sphagniphila]|uniref:Ligase-associated DNA damage response DEXH box helicase n=1 Tax=Telmatocola sphagniphila TaxID=1123043 RepID=A0A8E6B8M6_9BACT|nr:ligase-associated DNA damage response DEXH box helicase [Telmatocola sphagniphila]QVL33781.1 ligase-associated DNA damage response DEXH box helicase [Telmatocola sphagniphila]